MIPFNKPHLTGKEAHYLYQAVLSGKISGNGIFTQKCHRFFEERYGFKKCLLTSSCTDALEMAAILADIQSGDEVIMPSYTFVSTALAFIRQGAKIVFADSCADHPNIDAEQIEALISSKTKAIVVVHYAGIACDMDTIMCLAKQYNLLVIEDAAQAVDAFYQDRPLGGIGHFACFSFHETKNVISGEGGMLVINDERFTRRSEIIWEKGTNRAAFFRGEVDKYEWIDIGSSFLPSEIIAAFLYAQLENIDDIQKRRKKLWQTYYECLLPLANKGQFLLPAMTEHASNNAHLFYLVCPSLAARTRLIATLKKNNVLSVFHYLSLHSSAYYKKKHGDRTLPNCDRFADCLVRLPLFYELEVEEIKFIVHILSTL